MTQIRMFSDTKVYINIQNIIFFNWLYDFVFQIEEIKSLGPIHRFDNLLIAVTIV